jgi:hypothetical protein
VLKIRESYLRGYKIEMHNGEWVFSDTKESTVATWQKRPCGHCGKYNTIEGHDGCLGTLSGVMNACCGHGQENDAYVQFLDGFSIHGKDAVTVMQILKKHSKRVKKIVRIDD